METAFPLQERRNSKLQRENVDHHPLFHNTLITDDESPIGLLTYWDFTDFIYIEHFAINPHLRNTGYGQRALSLLKEQMKVPIVLEVEEPMDKLAIRRIGFYQRQGFILKDFLYRQPPYRSGDDWFPMKLMIHGEIEMNEETIQSILYKEVYQIKT